MTTTAAVFLQEIMAAKLGAVDPAKFPDEVFDLYSIPAFDRGVPDIVAGNEIGSAKQIVEPGDVLLSKIVPHIRRSWIVGENRGRRIIASGEWIVFRGSRFDPKYLRHVLVGDSFHARFMSTVSGVGGSLLRARPAHVARIDISLPSLPEQRRIAAILDKADTIRKKRQQGTPMIDTLLQSAFLDFFGHPGRNNFGYQQENIGNLCDRVMSIDPSATATANTMFRYIELGGVDGKFGRITNIADFLGKDAPSRARQLVKKGDVLVATVRPNLRGTALVGDEQDGILCSTGFCVLRCKERILPSYLYRITRIPWFAEQLMTKVKGANYPAVGDKDIYSIRVPVPPIEKQGRFQKIAEIAESSLTRMTGNARDSEFLYQSLVQSAFRSKAQ